MFRKRIGKIINEIQEEILYFRQHYLLKNRMTFCHDCGVALDTKHPETKKNQIPILYREDLYLHFCSLHKKDASYAKWDGNKYQYFKSTEVQYGEGK